MWYNTITKRKCPEKGLVCLATPRKQSSPEEIQDMNSRKGRRMNHRGKLLSDLLSIACPACIGLDSPKPVMKKMPHRHIHTTIWWRQFLNWGFLFSKDYFVCWEKLTSTWEHLYWGTGTFRLILSRYWDIVFYYSLFCFILLVCFGFWDSISYWT